MRKKIFLSLLLGITSQSYAQTSVFYETFDDDSPSVSQWSTMDLNGDSSSWFLTDANSWGFSGRAYADLSWGAPQDDVLISPVINLPSTGNLNLSYLVAGFSTNMPEEHYEVYILPSNAVFTGSEVPIFQETLGINEAQNASARNINITSFAGQSVKIFFRYNCNQRAILLDNVKISQGNILGTSDLKLNAQIGIYPNPTTDYVHIVSKKDVLKVNIYDKSGRQVKAELEGSKINIKNLQPGNYILRLETKDGITSEKFIKK